MIRADIDLLVPELKEKAAAAIALMKADAELKRLGVTGIIINETLRMLTVQMAYYSQGRMSAPDVQEMYKAAGLYAVSDADAQRVITWTLKSSHLSGRAIDIAPVKGARIWWNAPDAVWERMGTIGESCGLSWGGRWQDRKRDTPHYELEA